MPSLDGELSPRRQFLVTQHVEGCRICQEKADSLRSTTSTIERLYRGEYGGSTRPPDRGRVRLAAAYRFGHSMVREVYSHNRIFTAGGVAPATLQLLFQFTGLSGGIVGDLAPDPATAPTPIPVLSSNWIIDWRRFHDVVAPNPAGVASNASRKLDPFVVPALHTLPGGGGSLPFRNLKRGVMLGLPSGQDVATAMKIANPLTPEEIATGPDGAVAKKHGLHLRTPLWYYILKEAEQRGSGGRLGPVGATIVAEVFVGLVHGDHRSYLWLKGKDWKPELPSRTPGEFTMADLLRFMADISPIDGISNV